MTITKRQKIALAVGAAAIVGICLFPPWSVKRSAGY